MGEEEKEGGEQKSRKALLKYVNDNVTVLALSECEDLCPLPQHSLGFLKILREEEVHEHSYLGI